MRPCTVLIVAVVALACASIAEAGPRNSYYGCICQNTFFFNDSSAVYPGDYDRSGELVHTVLGECKDTIPPSPHASLLPFDPPTLVQSPWCYVQSWSCKGALPEFQYDTVNEMWWDYCNCQGGKGSGSQQGCFRESQQGKEKNHPLLGWWPTYVSF